MSVEKLHNILIFDHSLRWKLAGWSIAIGALCGTFFSSVVGLYGSALLSLVCAAATFLLCVAWHSPRSLSPGVKGELTQRREVLRQAVYAVSEGAVATVGLAVLGSTSSAIAYASSATDAMITNGTSANPVRVAIATEAVARALARGAAENREMLLRAQAQLIAARDFSNIKEKTQDVARPEANWRAALKIEKSITLRGQGRTSTNISIGKMDAIFAIASPAFKLESMGFRTAVVPPPAIFRFVSNPNMLGSPQLIVKDCLFRGFRQNLDRITWIDVVFQDCIIDSVTNEVTLINVSFENCIIPPLISSISSPITFSSSGDRLPS